MVSTAASVLRRLSLTFGVLDLELDVVVRLGEEELIQVGFHLETELDHVALALGQALQVSQLVALNAALVVAYCAINGVSAFWCNKKTGIRI